MPDMKTYHHMSAFDGIIQTMQFDGHAYKAVGPGKKIAASEFEKEITPEKVAVTTTK